MLRNSLQSTTTVPTNDFFSFHVKHTNTKTRLVMQCFTKEVHTGKMVHTLPILRKFLPTILGSTCFNEGNTPFRVEVRRTELGHLFEHILLEYLCQAKLAKGFDEAIFSGTTDWNWNKYPRGTFQITISAGKKESGIFPLAFQNAVTLFALILDKHKEIISKTSGTNTKEAAVTLPL